MGSATAQPTSGSLSALVVTVTKTLAKALWRKSVVIVIVFVACWNILTSSDEVGAFLQGPGLLKGTAYDIRQVNIHLQLRLYQWLLSLRAVPREPKLVSLVFIDDATHWSTLYGDVPTNRKYLATLIRNATDPNTKASIIALDIDLDAPLGLVAGMDEPDRKRQSENKDLLDAIISAADHGVSVVLTKTYVHKQGRKTLLPNIYSEDQLPLVDQKGKCARAACVSFGFTNAPEDHREIPLEQNVFEWDGSGPRTLASFALAIADKALSTTEQNPVIADAINNRKPLYGSFVREGAFQLINAEDLASGNAQAKAKCQNRIVLIGGRWHDLQGYGALVDGHFSPTGMISGLAFHANYVESLLFDGFSLEVPLWFAVLLDILVGLIIYSSFSVISDRVASRKKPRFLAIGAAVVLGSLLPLFVAYVALVSFNRYLDFLLPVELYFLHLIYELIRDYVHAKRAEKVSSAAV